MFGSNKVIKNILGTSRRRGGKNDWDGDGIPNRKDCQPRNTMRQDNKPYIVRSHGYPIRFYKHKQPSQELVNAMGEFVSRMAAQKRFGAVSPHYKAKDEFNILAQEIGSRLSPQTQQQFIDELRAKRYGIKYTKR